jgi:hypothetical protein
MFWKTLLNQRRRVWKRNSGEKRERKEERKEREGGKEK